MSELKTIQITVQSEEFETITLELSSEEVASLYKLRKEQAAKIVELEKEIGNLKTNKKYAEDARDEAKSELEQSHTLLTALGVADKTDHEESYYRKDLKVVTRIALYIAGVKK